MPELTQYCEGAAGKSSNHDVEVGALALLVDAVAIVDSAVVG